MNKVTQFGNLFDDQQEFKKNLAYEAIAELEHILRTNDSILIDKVRDLFGSAFVSKLETLEAKNKVTDASFIEWLAYATEEEVLH